MRAFASFLAALCAAALLGAALAYPGFELARHLGPWPFHRVANRITLLVLILELVVLSRLAGLTTKRDWGYGLPWRRFLTVALVAGGAGVASAALGAAFLLETQLRVWADPAALAAPGVWAHWLGAGLASGIAVALIEESVMRGALHTAIARESGELAAALLTAPLFAVLHFYARSTIPPQSVDAASGFVLLAHFFSPWAHPAAVLDSYLAWLAVGLVLSLTRILTGNIAIAVGLHAGWVMVLRVLQQGTVRGTEPAYAAWVGQYDGLLGYWLLPWTFAIALALWLTRRSWTPHARAASWSSRSMGSSSSR